MGWKTYTSVTALAGLILVTFGSSASAYFQSIPSDPRANYECGDAGCTYELTVEGSKFSIPYNIEVFSDPDPDAKSLNVTSISADTDKKSLIIDVSATSGGKLYLGLPKDLIQASQNGADIDYVIFRDGQKADSIDASEVSAGGDDMRTLAIRFSKNTKQIEIVGTQIAPEFGSIAAIVAAATIAGIIIATKYRRMPGYSACFKP